MLQRKEFRPSWPALPRHVGATDMLLEACDKDGDGTVGVNELRAFLRAYDPTPLRMAAERARKARSSSSTAEPLHPTPPQQHPTHPICSMTPMPGQNDFIAAPSTSTSGASHRRTLTTLTPNPPNPPYTSRPNSFPP